MYQFTWLMLLCLQFFSETFARQLSPDDDNMPQMLCSASGECTFFDHNGNNDKNSEYWPDYDGNVPPNDDNWFELVGNKLNRFPPLTHSVQTSPPISNIVHLPMRHVRPQRLRPADLAALHATRYPASRSSTTTATSTQRIHHSPSELPLEDELSETSTEATMTSQVSHVVLFKMLLLIAFVAVPIVSATLPLLMPTQMTRSRRDDTVLSWATHSATLIALAHIASDERLPQLLKLHDEVFVDALSAAVTNPLKNLGVNSGDLNRTKEELRKVALKLLQTAQLWDDFLNLTDENEKSDNQRWDKYKRSSDEKFDNF